MRSVAFKQLICNILPTTCHKNIVVSFVKHIPCQQCHIKEQCTNLMKIYKQIFSAEQTRTRKHHILTEEMLNDTGD